MVVDFSKIKEEPLLLLKNVDGTVIQPLGFAFDLKPEFHYNETSQISFVVPKSVNGRPTPGYDKITGLRIIEWAGIGQFILIDPKVTRDGLVEKKECRAYSLEYELTYKNITIPDEEYPRNFWDPAHPSDTVVGILMDEFPQWSWVVVDSELQGKYRTLSNVNNNGYNFIKSNLQTTYSCIFDFDTSTRTAYIYSASRSLGTAGVYISNQNLAKEIELEEKTEDVVTVLDVSGAEGVDIRSVNPLGTNKIYNLDYYLGAGYFSDSLVEHWEDWKSAYAAEREHYFNTATELTLKTSQIVAEEAALSELENNELARMKNEQSTYIEILSSLLTSNPQYEHYQELLDNCNTRIAAKEADVATKKALIDDTLIPEREDLLAALQDIRDAVAMEEFLSPEEMATLCIFFKEDSITEDSFVYSEVDSYVNAGNSILLDNGSTFEMTDAAVTRVDTTSDKVIYTITGGAAYFTSGAHAMYAQSIRCSAELDEQTNDVVLSVYLSSGEYDEDAFPKGCLTISGSYDSFTDNCVLDPETGAYSIGSSVEIEFAEGNMYLTKNTSDYEKYAVAWDLLEYGEDCLRKLAYPSYSFSVSSANFFSLEDFESFARSIKLGKKIYLDIGDRVIEPIFIGASLDYEDKASLTLEFSDTYDGNDAAFSLVDLLDQSIAMGKTVSSERFGYNAFIDSGASTQVRDFMNRALDVSKNAIISASDQAASWDSSGIHLRKWNAGQTGYEPEEIAMINNKIVFTDDAWNTAKMAIGLIQDSSLERFEFSNDGLSVSFSGGNRSLWDAFAATLNPNVPYILTYSSSAGKWAHGSAEYSLSADFGMTLTGTPANGDMLTVTHPSGNAWGIVAPNIVGTLLAGQNLIIESEKQDGGVAAFKVDADGAALYNSTFELVSGQKHILLDPNLGFGIGAYPIADADRTAWDTDKTKFWVDTNGDVHLKGDITGSNGTFSGVVKATDFLDADGNSMMTNGKFKSNVLDLGNIVIDGENTEIDIGDGGVIDIGNSTNGITISQSGISFRGHGAPSSYDDGDVKSYLKTHYGITDTETTNVGSCYIYSPTIMANEFDVFPTNETDLTGDFNIYGMHDGNQYHMFRIHYQGQPAASAAAPRVTIESPQGAEVWVSGSGLHLGSYYGDSYEQYRHTYFHGNLVLGEYMYGDSYEYVYSPMEGSLFFVI